LRLGLRAENRAKPTFGHMERTLPAWRSGTCSPRHPFKENPK
jgi:hypothetical protein